MLAATLRAEADASVAQHAEEALPDGCRRLVRHGYGPERSVQTGIGALELRHPEARDRAADVPAGNKSRFSLGILPRLVPRSKSFDALLPVLYPRGILTGDFQEALFAVFGTDAPNLLLNVISRLASPRAKLKLASPDRAASPKFGHSSILLADGAFDRGKLMDKAAYLDFTVEVVRRIDKERCFKVLPRRGVVERTFAWLT